MDLLNCLQTIDDNWDECMGNPELRQKIQPSTNFYELRKDLIKEINDLENQLLQNYLNCDVIKNFDSEFQPIFNKSKEIKHDISNSLNLLKLISEIDESRKESPEQIFCNDMLQLENYLSRQLVFQINHQNYLEFHLGNMNCLDTIERIRKILSKYKGCEVLFQDELQTFQSTINQNIQIAKEFINNIVKQNTAIQNISRYRRYFLFYTDETNYDAIKQFQVKCVEESVESLFKQSFPSNTLVSAIEKGLSAFYNTKQFDYKHPGIARLLSYQKDDTVPLNAFTDDMMDRIEFRLLKFIVELPSIVSDRIGLLNSILNKYPGDERVFQTKFQDTLKKRFLGYLDSSNVFNAGSFLGHNRNDIQTPMFWCFMHRMAVYEETSVPPPKEPYTQFIMTMLQETTNICQKHCNQLFKNYDMETKLNKAFNSILAKYNKAERSPESQEIFINSFISIYEEYIFPVCDQIKLFYENVVIIRDLGNPWYSFMLDRLNENAWFIKYYARLQELPIFHGIQKMLEYLDSKYVSLFICKALAFPQFLIITNEVKRLFELYAKSFFKNLTAKYKLFVFTYMVKSNSDAETIINLYDEYINDLAAVISTILGYVKNDVDQEMVSNYKQFAINYYKGFYDTIYKRCSTLLTDGQSMHDPNQFSYTLASKIE